MLFQLKHFEKSISSNVACLEVEHLAGSQEMYMPAGLQPAMMGPIQDWKTF